MKRMLRKFDHALGITMVIFGFILCIGAAGNSDLNGEMAVSVRYLMSGLSAVAAGVVLTWM